MVPNRLDNPDTHGLHLDDDKEDPEVLPRDVPGEHAELPALGLQLETQGLVPNKLQDPPQLSAGATTPLGDALVPGILFKQIPHEYTGEVIHYDKRLPLSKMKILHSSEDSHEVAIDFTATFMAVLDRWFKHQFYLEFDTLVDQHGEDPAAMEGLKEALRSPQFRAKYRVEDENAFQGARIVKKQQRLFS